MILEVELKYFPEGASSILIYPQKVQVFLTYCLLWFAQLLSIFKKENMLYIYNFTVKS